MSEEEWEVMHLLAKLDPITDGSEGVAKCTALCGHTDEDDDFVTDAYTSLRSDVDCPECLRLMAVTPNQGARGT